MHVWTPHRVTATFRPKRCPAAAEGGEPKRHPRYRPHLPHSRAKANSRSRYPNQQTLSVPLSATSKSHSFQPLAGSKNRLESTHLPTKNGTLPVENGSTKNSRQGSPSWRRTLLNQQLATKFNLSLKRRIREKDICGRRVNEPLLGGETFTMWLVQMITSYARKRIPSSKIYNQ